MPRVRRHADGKIINLCSWERSPGGRGIVLYDEAGAPTHIDDWRDIAVAYPAPVCQMNTVQARQGEHGIS
jgi:hypothetical protein